MEDVKHYNTQLALEILKLIHSGKNSGSALETDLKESTNLKKPNDVAWGIEPGNTLASMSNTNKDTTYGVLLNRVAGIDPIFSIMSDLAPRLDDVWGDLVLQWLTDNGYCPKNKLPPSKTLQPDIKNHKA